MITLKSKREIEEMRKSGELLADVHRHLRSFIKPGVTSWDIEVFVRNFIEEHGGIAAQIGYDGYKYATCCSINDEICHGFPRKKELKNGDLINVDMCIDLKGALSDSGWSYVVGESTSEIDHLMNVTRKALYIGIEQAKVGNRIGDIGHAIQTYVEGEGLSVVRDFIGHGIGPTIHEDPAVPHYGIAGKGLRLKEGMIITIEPMVNTGTWKMKMDPNGWTAYTRDGGLSCQFEHTLAIQKEGPQILTSQGEELTY
ncbi:type I methionyl aminopeptidase [Melissococcus plutonius]|uniref:Methionine aminopeptidase n=2 Tax=Melissococcus plutonius TaxID=33970 RepID=F3Y9T3_MELPT|nr:type I methionyl aminopeptidase [Melissococcus plutonius]BAL62363.1 methionine aminopeptidase [Melissococcus plutonius DAT561]AIM24793.1 methionine aminopeptidase A [Melissococcus plutonius S1]KMT24910.1 methionine aminopeptidase A [Melissococcus plutonius]KMT26547.1 methionine aminopeptidase A [Melissococcus plutonius]KMT27797.1 methionine aminopeptidase A [Melissococcus plutonius]